MSAPGQIDLFDCEPPPVRSGGDISAFMAVMARVIDRSVAGLEQKHAHFRDDPICGPERARTASIVGSVQKRHGHILEVALKEALRESGEHRVWAEQKFVISAAADALFNSQTEDDCGRSELPYGDGHRVIQIDVGAFNPGTTSIGAYEIKRANGLHDAGKIRSMRRDLACTRLLLRSYGSVHGMAASAATAQVIFYYGQRSIPPPYSLIGAELDDHFGFPVTARIEAANKYFRQRLEPLWEQIA